MEHPPTTIQHKIPTPPYLQFIERKIAEVTFVTEITTKAHFLHSPLMQKTLERLLVIISYIFCNYAISLAF